MKRKILSIAFYCILFVAVPALAQKLPSRGLCAHRGASGTHPENTLAAIAEAVRLGAQMIEFDLRRTKDDAVILLHDATVDRTTDGKGKVEDLTFTEIRQLDAGSWKDQRFRGEKIPTFQEVLQVVPGHIWMNIHIKSGDAVLAEKTARMIAQAGCIRNAFVACMKRELAVIRGIDPAIKICYMERQTQVEDYVQDTIRAKADFIQLTRDAFPELARLTKTLKEKGIGINCFYAKSKEEVKMSWDAGDDLPLVDDLQAMKD